MKKHIKRFELYGIIITEDESAFYLEDELGNLLSEPFVKRLPEVIDGVTYYPTNEEVWIVAGSLISAMEQGLSVLD